MNHLGYEDLAEYYVSELLKCSNIINFVEYNLCIFNGKSGCYSHNMLNTNEKLVTLGRILNLYGVTQNKINSLKSTSDKFELITDTIYNSIDLDITTYLSNLIALDCITLNEDRHLHNIALICDTETDIYRECPIFDNGLSLLSDTYNYGLDTSTYKNYRKVKARPISSSFKKQFDVCRPTIKFDLTKVESLLQTIDNKRIKYILEQSTNKYPSLFENITKVR